MSGKTSVTVAIPIYDEEANIRELVTRLRKVSEKLPEFDLRYLLIDDGSRDNSLAILEEEASHHSDISALVFSRNFGHQAAVSAAFDTSTTDYLIVMDGDLQDPPEIIPELLNKAKEGHEVVYVSRHSRKDSVMRHFIYRCYYRLLDVLSEIPVQLDSGDFALYSRRAVEILRAMPEQHRFHRGMRAWIGFRQAGVPIDRPSRYAGKSKYSLIKLMKLGFSGLLSFSLVPLRLAVLLGASCLFFCTCFLIYSLLIYFLGFEVPTGFTALVVVLIFTSGVQLTVLGIIGEYLGRVYDQGKRRPLYIVDRVVGALPAEKAPQDQHE